MTFLRLEQKENLRAGAFKLPLYTIRCWKMFLVVVVGMCVVCIRDETEYMLAVCHTLLSQLSNKNGKFTNFRYIASQYHSSLDHCVSLLLKSECHCGNKCETKNDIQKQNDTNEIHLNERKMLISQQTLRSTITTIQCKTKVFINTLKYQSNNNNRTLTVCCADWNRFHTSK